MGVFKRREKIHFPSLCLGCYTAVFSVVTQRSSQLTQRMGGALRDDTKNGCVADYSLPGEKRNHIS